MDIFGVSDYTTSPECIACLTDPRDTILLPCRHLCVCKDCFERLTLDRCPVCRAPFDSYLRFTNPEPPENDVAPPSVPVSDPPVSETSEAPSTEPFLPPEPNGGSSGAAHRSIDILGADENAGGDPLGVSAPGALTLEERRC